jgi:hypothetical protein
MRVKLLTIMAGPKHGSHDVGEILNLPDAEAKELIDANSAVEVTEETPTKGRRRPAETMTAEPKGERAVSEEYPSHVTSRLAAQEAEDEAKKGGKGGKR